MNIFDIINVPLGYLLRLCYKLIPNYALALLLFAIIIKAVLFPLGIKQQKSSVRQAQMRPREMAIRNRYAGRTDKATQMKMNEEIQKFYQAENYNPAAGCLPMLVELPVIFALYNVITNPLKYLVGWSNEVISAISARITELGYTAATHINMINVLKSDFASFSDVLPEGTTLSTLPDFNVFGGFLDLSATPSFSEMSWLLVIPVITFIAVFGSTKLIRKFTYQPVSDSQTGLSMKIMDFTMPLFSVWISFSVPAVVGLYWIYQNVLSVVRQIILYKMYPIPQFTEEDYKAAEREMNGKMPRSERKRLKSQSLHNIDDVIPDTPENTLDEDSDSKLPEKKNALDVAAPKDSTVKPRDKSKPRPHSLHRIDDEIPDTPENTLMLDSNGNRIMPEKKDKPEDEADGADASPEVKKEDKKAAENNKNSDAKKSDDK